MSPEVLEAVRDLHAADSTGYCWECTIIRAPDDYDAADSVIYWPCPTAELVYDEDEIALYLRLKKERHKRELERGLTRRAEAEARRSLGTMTMDDWVVTAWQRQIEFALTAKPLFRNFA